MWRKRHAVTHTFELQNIIFSRELQVALRYEAYNTHPPSEAGEVQEVSYGENATAAIKFVKEDRKFGKSDQ